MKSLPFVRSFSFVYLKWAQGPRLESRWSHYHQGAKLTGFSPGNSIWFSLSSLMICNPLFQLVHKSVDSLGSSIQIRLHINWTFFFWNSNAEVGTHLNANKETISQDADGCVGGSWRTGSLWRPSSNSSCVYKPAAPTRTGKIMQRVKRLHILHL